MKVGNHSVFESGILQDGCHDVFIYRSKPLTPLGATSVASHVTRAETVPITSHGPGGVAMKQTKLLGQLNFCHIEDFQKMTSPCKS
jgi:hypothetical protein